MPKRKLPDAPTPNRDPRIARREATLYDALADRVTGNGFQPATHKRASKPKRSLPVHPSSALDMLDGASRDRATTRFGLIAKNNHPLPPDLVLRHRKYAPTIPVPDAHASLPDPDLLFALHQYASDFYDRTRNGRVGLRSMDETALLALGCLVEEEVRGVVGAGAGVFVERGVGDVYEGIGEGGGGGGGGLRIEDDEEEVGEEDGWNDSGDGEDGAEEEG
ncbi:hypothetical protein SAICODRAFT_27782 [Saitoella complicata NRRL Y-17804]|uniref:uncharacterized protein n=1 Tax=Saitoella complicata (strain BCRC 22490 / CBS 7301 / JCM 7358 / NBRC 10748 / NRRL Y-17804) TaxID=698492 RepID=UPI0008676797|nr:uncharacterized protein SAICODRAFT_27782 [Saitoella complicata NRRL Y-17804]ODQ50074.1 hypothetical protein SAICODRAFT_27782 [Saitoella complicata NRRL Y-17804]